MHIVSPFSAAWSGWTMLGLLLCAALSEFFQPGVITQAHTSFFAQTDRTYKNAPSNPFGQTLIGVFRLGTLAMAICLCIDGYSSFPFVCYAIVGGLTLATLLVKMLCNKLIDYTFSISRRGGQIFEHYGDISTIATCILFPGMLLMIRVGDPQISRWVVGAISVLFILMWTIRLVNDYTFSLRSIVYIILYTATLEVLPLGVLYYLSSKTISAL